MSVGEVQARTAAIAHRLEALRAGTPLAGGSTVARGTLGAGGATFADVLQQAGAATTTAGVPAAASAATGSRAVALASTQVGTPYVFGGERPGGFDCSGLVQWTYGQLGVDLPRVASQQGKAGVEVSAAQAQPGDLVYFDRQGPVDHIGIYAGGGTWVVAPRTGDVVKLQDVDLSRATSIRRVTGQAGAPAAVPAAVGDWAAALPPQGRGFAPAIARAAAAEGVDPALLSAVAWTESGFRPGAASSAGAQGLMQIMPATARGLGVDPLDPEQALTGGARYLRQQLDAFGGRADLALAAYNAGPTAVRRAGGVPEYPETQAYVTRVLDRYRQLGGTA
jgi:cell wall-associated NlpC family hydrolase